MPPPRPTTPASGPQPSNVYTAPREVKLNAGQAPPPTNLYLQPEDQVRLLIYTPTAGLNFYVDLFLRWLRPDGEITVLRQHIQVISNGQGQQFVPGEGWLLSASLYTANLNQSDPGRCFAICWIERDNPESYQPSFVLFNDYLTDIHYPSWPNGRSIAPQEGAGALRSITGTTPAAGAEISEVVPASTRWRLLAARWTLVTSAAVANRAHQIILDDGANPFYRWTTNAQTTASNTATIALANWGYSGTNDNNNAYLILPDNVLLPAGARFRTSTNGLQAGDQYSAPQYLVQEWVSQ